MQTWCFPVQKLVRVTRKVLCNVAEELVNWFVQLPAHGEGPWSYLGSPQCGVKYTELQGYQFGLGASMLPNHGAADCDELGFGPAQLIEVRSLSARKLSNAVSVSELIQRSFGLHYHCLEVTSTIVDSEPALGWQQLLRSEVHRYLS